MSTLQPRYPAAALEQMSRIELVDYIPQPPGKEEKVRRKSPVIYG